MTAEWKFAAVVVNDKTGDSFLDRTCTIADRKHYVANGYRVIVIPMNRRMGGVR